MLHLLPKIALKMGFFHSQFRNTLAFCVDFLLRGDADLLGQLIQIMRIPLVVRARLSGWLGEAE
jgi:hypothetical protein